MVSNKKGELKLIMQEVMSLRKATGAHGDPEALAQALVVAKDEKVQLEHKLSCETKVKMDLLAAYGEARRELEEKPTALREAKRQLEIRESKFAS